ERGTYIPMDELPGPLCHTVDEVIESIQHIDKMMKRYKKIYERFVQEYCYHDNGRATERFVDAVFEEKHSEHLFKIGTDKTKIKKSKEIHMQKMDKNVHHIFRFGTWNASLADLYRHTLFLSTGKRKVAPAKMYQKEMERITGLTKFDIGIDFGGYSPFWAAL